MSHSEADGVQGQTGRSGSAINPSDPTPQQPMAHVHGDPERDEAVRQLADALRAAERAHRAFQSELRQGDVEPVDDWPTWYAEYLLDVIEKRY